VATAKSGGRLYPLIGLGWLAAALVLGASGQLNRLRPPAPQAVLLGLTLALVVAGATLQGFRHWLAGINLRQLVAFHIVRFVGIYFLVLYSRGELPYAFAVPGGWGDIAVATGALLLVLLVPDLGARRSWVLAWNVLGLTDIVYVVLTASRLATANPESMQALLRLPLSLLPTFLVPLIIASHLYLLRRLRTERVKGHS
jgi:hypothetical protein